MQDLVFTWSQGTQNSKSVVCLTSGFRGLSCGYKYAYTNVPRGGIFISASCNNGSGGSTSVSYASPEALYFGRSVFVFNTDQGSSGTPYECANIRVRPISAAPIDDFTITFSNSLPSDMLPSAPSGTLSITENGTYNVSSYASAEVDVPPIYGDYHDDLVNINHSIVVASAVILVIYFFWCIYRMIIKPLRS